MAAVLVHSFLNSQGLGLHRVNNKQIDLGSLSVNTDKGKSSLVNTNECGFG